MINQNHYKQISNQPKILQHLLINFNRFNNHNNKNNTYYIHNYLNSMKLRKKQQLNPIQIIFSIKNQGYSLNI